MQCSIEYLAGFFDGEGNVSMCYDKANDMTRCRLSMFNTHRGVLEHIQATYGGFIHDGKLKAVYRKDHWKPPHTLIIQLSKKHLVFIEDLAKASIVKKNKLLLAAEYIRTLRRAGGRGQDGIEGVKEARRAMIGKMNDNRAATTTERAGPLKGDATV